MFKYIKELQKNNVLPRIQSLLQSMGCKFKNNFFTTSGESLIFDYKDQEVSVTASPLLLMKFPDVGSSVRAFPGKYSRLAPSMVFCIKLNFRANDYWASTIFHEHQGKKYIIIGNCFECFDIIKLNITKDELILMLDELITAKEHWVNSLDKIPTWKDVILKRQNLMNIVLAFTSVLLLILHNLVLDSQLKDGLLLVFLMLLLILLFKILKQSTIIVPKNENCTRN